MSVITESCVIVRLQTHAIGAVKKFDPKFMKARADAAPEPEPPEGLNKTELRKWEAEQRRAKKRVSGVKTLFDSPEYKAIISSYAELREWMRRRALPILRKDKSENEDEMVSENSGGLIGDGFYLMPIALLDQVEGRMMIFTESELPDMVETFLTRLPDEKARCKADLDKEAPGAFDESDYPPEAEVRRRFWVTKLYVMFKAPETLPPEMRERAEQALEQQFQYIADNVTAALTGGFVDLVAHLTDRLQLTEDGRPKTFHESSIDNLIEFLELFSARNITNNAQLAALAAKAQAIINDADPKRLRKDMDFRRKIATSMGDIRAELDKLVEVQGVRKFDLDD